MLIDGLLLLGVCIGIMFEAFFAVAEISLVVSDKLMFLDREEKQKQEIMPLLKILSDPQRITHTLFVGWILAGGMSVLFFTLLILRLPQGLSVTESTFMVLGILFPLTILLGEFIPRTFFNQQAEETAIWIAKPLLSCMVVLRPFINLSLRFYQTVQSLTGRSKEENPFVEDEELEWIRRFAQESETFPKEEMRIIRKIFDFSEIRVRDIFVPIDRVVSVSEETIASQAVEQILESGFTRLPVYRGETKKIVGLLHAHDFLRVESLDREVAGYCRKPFFVSADTLVRDLFRSMQKRGIMMAVVIDCEGEAQGIVTMEDILEEIFGEIEDEYDLKDHLYRKVGESEYLVDAGIGVQVLNEQLYLDIPDNGYRTLSGYILSHLRRIPQEGERFTIGNLMFKIELADEKKIYKLFLRQLRSH